MSSNFIQNFPSYTRLIQKVRLQKFVKIEKIIYWIREDNVKSKDVTIFYYASIRSLSLGAPFRYVFFYISGAIS